MSFRKRNAPIASANAARVPAGTTEPIAPRASRSPGTRASPVDGCSVTSTGTPSLDSLLAGHSGLPLGTSVLVEETGSTDYGGTILRYFAAEGILQGHMVHVLGMNESWGRELPGLAEEKDSDRSSKHEASSKMKIAWRYEGLGLHGARSNRGPSSNPISPSQPHSTTPFSHVFDLTKRLPTPSPDLLKYYNLSSSNTSSAFNTIISKLQTAISNSPPSTVHRIIIPSLLSPLLYPPDAAEPTILLPFLHSLRALLRQHHSKMAVMASFPLTLYPRTSGLTRWIEILHDGVLELSPFAHNHPLSQSDPDKEKASDELHQHPQGILNVHRLPVFHEKGGGGSGGRAGGIDVGVEDNLAFTVSRKKFEIGLFSLPPIDAEDGGRDRESKAADPEKAGKISAKDLEF